MGFQEAVRTVLTQKYADFTGRASRSEFWWWALANFLIYLVLYILAIAVHIFFVLVILYALAVIVPGLAVGCRRLHDSNKSGWLQLIAIVPFVGGLALLVLFCLDSTPGPNQYGPHPSGMGGGYMPGGYMPNTGYGGQPYGGQPYGGQQPYGTAPGYGAPPPPPPGYGQPPTSYGEQPPVPPQ